MARTEHLAGERVTHYEWHGNLLVLVALFALVITIPLAAVYFLTRLIKVETLIANADELSDFLEKRRKSA